MMFRTIGIVAAALVTTGVCARTSEGQAAKKSATAYVIEARAAAAGGKHFEAHDLYRLALKAEPRNENALRGKAALHLKDGEWTAAADLLEKVLSARPGDRAVSMNLAAAYLECDPPNAMRAAKVVKDYLAGSRGTPDEAAQNVLGAALLRADDQARNGSFFEEVRRFYFDYDKKLEQGRRDGKKRWGSEWLDAELAETKWRKLKTNTEAVKAAHRSWSEATVQTRKSREALEQLRLSFELKPQHRIQAARQRVTVAQRQEAQAAKRLDTARKELAKAEAPPMQEKVGMVVME